MGDGASEPTDRAKVVVTTLQTFERASRRRLDKQSVAEIDAIFFASSNTQSFATEQDRHAFRERWLGRYLERYREDFFIAAASEQRIVGYLAGCLEDPARQPLFADIGYFATLADLTRHFPAHLHINVDPEFRNVGIGVQLIEAFCNHAWTAGAPGVHVVTGASARNVRFYQRCDFHELRKMAWNGGVLTCLGRSLTT